MNPQCTIENVRDWLTSVAEAEKRISSDAHREALRKESGGDCYPTMYGQLSATLNLVELMRNRLNRVLADLQGVDCWTGTDHHKMPTWTISIPERATLSCPNCGAINDCDVSQDDDIDNSAKACFAAEIDTDFCEDCHKRLCPSCPRFPHTDDRQLIRCETCHQADTARNTEPYTGHQEVI